MTYTVPAGTYGDYSTAFIQAYIDQKIDDVVGLAPGTLDSLQELSAAIGDDPAFFTTVANQVAELNTDVTDIVTALGVVENDQDFGAFTAATLTDTTNLKAVLEAFASAYETTKGNLESADTGLSNRLDVLEADPTTQTLLTAETNARTNADTALSGRLDVLEVDPTTAAAVAAVQADVDQNESDSDAAELALSNRIDTLEADPTTQTAVDAKLNIANPAATGDLTVDTEARLEFDGNLTKLHNDLRGTSIEVGNNIQMKPAAAGGRVEIAGALQIDITEVPEASNDSQAAAAGVIIGGLYRSNSTLHIRVS